MGSQSERGLNTPTSAPSELRWRLHSWLQPASEEGGMEEHTSWLDCETKKQSRAFYEIKAVVAVHSARRPVEHQYSRKMILHGRLRVIKLTAW